MTWVSEVAILLSQWIGAIFILFGIWKMEKKNVLAPFFLIIGGLGMLTYGVLVQAWGVMLVNSVAVVLNYRVWKKWKQEADSFLEGAEKGFKIGMGKKDEF